MTKKLGTMTLNSNVYQNKRENIRSKHDMSISNNKIETNILKQIKIEKEKLS